MTKIDVLGKGYVRLVDYMGNDLSIVNAARVSYAKESDDFSDRDDRLLKFLVREGHLSPFRHAALTFEVYAPLFVARQWWKYAVASSHLEDQTGWNESSRRYITEEPEFYIPDGGSWRSKPANSKQGSGEPIDKSKGHQFTSILVDYILKGEELYKEAMDEEIAPEQARLFLPAYGMFVRWRWTTSLATVAHFLAERLEHDAQYEIQQYAKAVNDLTSKAFPKTLEALNAK
ncbi:ThyX-like thymidylate synthase [Streptomyces phage Sollertia]|nr:ThyX-like thymidylate synthase [Streptomyces phage Sollertia]